MSRPFDNAAAERVRAYLEAWGDEDGSYARTALSTVVVGTGQFIDLTSTDLRALLAALDEQHEQLRVLQATLAEILPTFREKGHPGFDATRSCWLETRRVDGWRAIAARTIIPCGATTLGLYSTPLRPCIYAAGHASHHRNDDGTIWVERVDSAGSGPNADADA